MRRLDAAFRPPVRTGRAVAIEGGVKPPHSKALRAFSWCFWVSDRALCGLLLRQAMERAETQHQINGMDAYYFTILE